MYVCNINMYLYSTFSPPSHVRTQGLVIVKRIKMNNVIYENACKFQESSPENLSHQIEKVF